MIVLVDLSSTQESDGNISHGAAEYALAFMKQLLARVPAGGQILGVALSGHSLDPRVRCLFKSDQVFYARSYHEISQYVCKFKGALFFSALPYEYSSCSFEGVRLLFTIHGLRKLEMPSDMHEWRYSRNVREFLRSVCKRLFSKIHFIKNKFKLQQLLDITCDNLFITVPSMHTKYSLLNNSEGLNADRIVICPSPLRVCDPSDSDESAALYDDYDVEPNRFILLVSCNRWVKNSYRALKSLDELISKGLLSYKIVLVGMSEANWLLRGIVNRSYFVPVGYVMPSSLEALYRDAFFMLYPTLNEGYGYPPLEAMKYGTPVIASAISAVPETCGNSALYFNPYSISELQNRVLQLIFDHEFRQALSRAGSAHYHEVIDDTERSLISLIDHVLMDMH
jgi:glycosyltransferase involved in cell wall biosynthesis